MGGSAAPFWVSSMAVLACSSASSARFTASRVARLGRLDLRLLQVLLREVVLVRRELVGAERLGLFDAEAAELTSMA